MHAVREIRWSEHSPCRSYWPHKAHLPPNVPPAEYGHRLRICGTSTALSGAHRSSALPTQAMQQPLPCNLRQPAMRECPYRLFSGKRRSSHHRKQTSRFSQRMFSRTPIGERRSLLQEIQTNSWTYGLPHPMQEQISQQSCPSGCMFPMHPSIFSVHRHPEQGYPVPQKRRQIISNMEILSRSMPIARQSALRICLF